jgi:hypothetical protein
MNVTKKSVFFGVLALGIIAIVLLSSLRHQPRLNRVTTDVSETSKLQASARATAPAAAEAQSGVVKSVAPAAIANPSIESSKGKATETGEIQGKAVEVRAEQALAKVNGVTITLKDLLPVGAAEAASKQSLSAERYDFLLNRAIARELTFQAAQAQGIKLTEEQNRQLKQVRESMLARYGTDPAKVVHLNVMGTLEDRIEFELRDAASPLLLHSMLAKAGAPSPYVTESQVEEYYRSHPTDYGTLPEDAVERQAAWQRINLEIRNKLTPEVQARYQQALEKMLEQLRANANIILVAKTN